MSYDFENKKINANVRTGELFQFMECKIII